MSTEVEDIIKNNDYAQLSSNELELVNEWASSEEEYSTMRQIIASAASLNKDIAPSPKLKASLMETFAAAHATATPIRTVASSEKKNRKVVYLWFRSAAAIAAVLLAVFIVYPLITKNDQTERVAENKTVQPKAKDKEISPVKESEEKAKKNDLEGVAVESPVQVAESRTITPTNGPNDGFARAESREKVIDNSQETLSLFDDVSSVANFTMSGNGISLVSAPAQSFSAKDNAHSDRLETADLPQYTRQVIHERPDILNLLHTSF